MPGLFALDAVGVMKVSGMGRSREMLEWGGVERIGVAIGDEVKGDAVVSCPIATNDRLFERTCDSVSSVEISFKSAAIDNIKRNGWLFEGLIRLKQLR